MLPPKSSPSPDQRQLLKLFRGLSVADRHSLLRYAEFLHQSSAAAVPPAGRDEDEAMVPADIPRPESESVVAAIRRLSQTFPMLDKEALLHETSALMTAHLMQGRGAVEVIDELEIVFRRHYERVNSDND